MTDNEDDVMAKVLTFHLAASPRSRDHACRICRHFRVGVDKHRRHVWCLDCEADLDPVEVISRYAESHSTMRQTLKSATDETWELLDQFRWDGGTLSITRTKGVRGSLVINGKKVQRKCCDPTASTATRVAQVIRDLRRVESQFGPEARKG